MNPNSKNVMKTLKTSIESFATVSLSKQEMNFIIGGGEPKDLIIPPGSVSRG
jgi:hypothetical protein